VEAVGIVEANGDFIAVNIQKTLAFMLTIVCVINSAR